MENFLDSLNDKQKQAASIINGPLLIIAGPGSGKTKTITHRIAHLIQQGIAPHHILAVTFTNKAAGEMKERVNALLRQNELCIAGAPLWGAPAMGTFHSICAKILRDTGSLLGYTPHFTVYDDDDQLRIIKNAMDRVKLSVKEHPPQKVMDTISRAKDELLGPIEFENIATDYPKNLVAKVYPIYQQTLKDHNAMDFGDLLFQTVLLFERNPDVLERYQNQFQYILVDEYQDTNGAQYKLIRQLAQKHHNVCCVGDDSQSIYSWRGADFRNILRFEKDWSDAKVVILDQNYRSTQIILDAATAVIDRNQYKTKKTLWTNNGEGKKIILKELDNEQEEGGYIIAEIERAVRELRVPLSECAILYRTNAQSRALEEAFLRYDFPYVLIGGVQFYKRKEVKDIISYLRLLANPKDIAALNRIINTPPRGIGKVAREKIGSDKEPTQATRFLEQIETLRGEMQTTPPHLLITKVAKEMGYEKYLRDGTKEGEERWENIGELISAAEFYKDTPPREALTQFLEKVALVQEADGRYNKDRVSLMTLHAAKGLEFSVVFIAGCEEGVFPHSRSATSQSELEEERRLCYVGITRAKQRLYFTFARTRMVFGSVHANPPSSFLFDIPEHLIDFRPIDHIDSGEEEVIEWG
ncbi:MAG: UvrD-helicase domain-containing protein [Candidatus Spechtbacteria bacterium]|nr:UvrD-helicase domain-containing protein [Candidatus Spechtbacteria bacterium]